MMRRRQVVRTLASAGIFGLGPWRPASAASVRKRRVRFTEPLSRDVFMALVLETFAVQADTRTVKMVLLDVQDGGASAFTDQFTLVFRGSLDTPLWANTYTVTHRTAGTTRLYFQPVGQDGHYSYYHAPFNLLQ